MTLFGGGDFSFKEGETLLVKREPFFCLVPKLGVKDHQWSLKGVKGVHSWFQNSGWGTHGGP